MPTAAPGLFGPSGQQHSLFNEILDWMLVPLLLLWPASIFLTYLVAQNIADRPFDRELGVVVRAIAQQAGIAPGRGDDPPQVQLRMPAIAADLLRDDDAHRVYFQVLGARGEFVAGDAGLPVPDAPAGRLGELQLRNETMRDEAVRVAYMWLPLPGAAADSTMLVQVAETLEKRARLANEIIKGVILPQFVILPLAVVLVWFALSRGIKPLARLQQRIRKREVTDLSPIDERDVPDEVVPLVRAINELLDRLDQSIRTQKQFLADAAHQLENAAGRAAHAGRVGRARDRYRRQRRRLIEAIAGGKRQVEPARRAHGQPAAGHGPRRRP